jgi:hypothetical protein
MLDEDNMLDEDKLKKLVEWFVYEGPFRKMLSKWSEDSSRDWYTKITVEMRQNVYRYLAQQEHVESAINLSNVVIQLVAFCGEENRKKTVEEWKKIADFNGPYAKTKSWSRNSYWEDLEKSEPELLQASQAFLNSEFKDSLNRITACGANVKDACAFMTSCIDPLTDGGKRFMHGRWQRFVEDNRIRQEHEKRQAAATAWAEKRREVTQKLKEMQELPLEELIEKCTDGLEFVEGDDDTFNMFRIMNGFKIAALLLQEKNDLDSNRRFLKLIADTSHSIWYAQERANIPDDNLRVQLANGILTLVNNKLEEERRKLEANRDAQPRAPEPAPEPAQPDVTPAPRKPFNLFDASTWGRRARASQALPSAQCRVACLLKELDECR